MCNHRQMALNYEHNKDPHHYHFLQDPTIFLLASSLKTDLLLHLLLRCYSQPEVGVILIRNKSDHDTFLPRVLEGSRSQSKWKSKSSQWVSWPSQSGFLWPLWSHPLSSPPGFALPWASWPPCSCWNWQPCSKLKALEPLCPQPVPS